MSDKLPVLQVIVYTADDGAQSVLGCAPESDVISVTGIERASKAALDSGAATLSRYEPAVPRCRTCALFWSDAPHDRECCPRLTMVARDGYGYCSEHVEARR